MLHNKRSHRNEKPAHHNEEQPRLAATRESPRAATKTQHSQKLKKKKKLEGEAERATQAEGTEYAKAQR